MTEQPDNCDRCGQEGRVYVDWSQETGYEGLCGECVDTRCEWAPTA